MPFKMTAGHAGEPTAAVPPLPELPPKALAPPLPAILPPKSLPPVLPPGAVAPPTLVTVPPVPEAPPLAELPPATPEPPPPSPVPAAASPLLLVAPELEQAAHMNTKEMSIDGWRMWTANVVACSHRSAFFRCSRWPGGSATAET